MAWTRRSVARVLADRRGASAVEYGVMALGGAVAILGAYNAFFHRIKDVLVAIAIPA